MSVVNNRPMFKVHSSPEAIREAMRQAERRMNEARNEWLWLKELLAARLAQVDAGEWPKGEPSDAS